MVNSDPSPPTPPVDLQASIKLIDCHQDHAAEWDKFVNRFGGTYCHLFGWKTVLERVYHLTTHYLAFEAGSEWVALLPFAIMPSLPWQRKRAISLPYCNYGGLVTNSKVGSGDLRLLAFDYLRRQGVRSVELREWALEPGNSGEITMLLSLPDSVDQLWELLGVKVRNQIRKAQRSGLTVHWGREQSAGLYEIYALKMSELGTPVHSPRFAEQILSHLAPHADVLTVRYQQRPVAAMLLIKFGDTWIDPMASSLTSFKMMNPNMLLYWEALRAACESHARHFDFGRSQRGSGTHRFKRQWGAKEVELNYQSYLDGEPVSAPPTAFYRSKAASRLAASWSVLPKGVQMKLGPVIRRWLP